MTDQTLSIASSVFESQIRALKKASALLGKPFENAVNQLLGCRGKIVLCGVGKSGLIGAKIAATLSSTGSPAIFLNANEALHGDLGILAEGDVLLMISKSGTTPELLRILPKARLLGIPCIGIFGNLKTPLAARLDVLLDGSIEDEGSPFGLAPMASTTVAMVLGDAIAAALMRAKGKTEADFASNHPAGQLGKNLLLKAEDVMHSGANLPRIGPEQSIKEAVLELTRKNLGGICVCREDMELMGFVTDGDIRKFLSSNDNLGEAVSAIMTHNPICCSPDMSLGQVLNLMENPGRQIYVAPVKDMHSGKVLGIIRMHDILNAH
jgi:arabinose-5-phosphate isomerase